MSIEQWWIDTLLLDHHRSFFFTFGGPREVVTHQCLISSDASRIPKEKREGESCQSLDSHASERTVEQQFEGRLSLLGISSLECLNSG